LIPTIGEIRVFTGDYGCLMGTGYDAGEAGTAKSRNGKFPGQQMKLPFINEGATRK